MLDLTLKTEELKTQRLEFMGMITRLQHGQEKNYQIKYKQPTVINYIETLIEQVAEISKELYKRKK